MKSIWLFIIILSALLSACQSLPPSDSTNTPSRVAQSTQTSTPLPLSPTVRTASPSTPSPLSPSPSITHPTETPTNTPTSTPPPPTTLLFTGVIVPARCVQAKIDEIGDPNYPYEEVVDIITGADLAIGTLNATISDYPPRTGCVRTYVLVGGADNADALANAGFDVMSVATNHIKNCGPANCGDRAFYDTLDNLRRVGISPVGAGVDHNDAMQPVVLEIIGVRFGFVSLGQIEPFAFAGEHEPGIAILNEENLRQAIDDARQVSDVVVAMPHWGPEDVPIPNWIQRDLAVELLDAGADLVVGNHTHVVQAIQEIDGVPVFYGLGNFVFDQDLEDHQQGVILLVTFQGTELVSYELIPTHVDEDGRVHIAGPEEAAAILERIESASQSIR